MLFEALPPRDAPWFLLLLVVWLVLPLLAAWKLRGSGVSRRGKWLFLLAGAVIFVARECCLRYLGLRIRTHTVTDPWLYRLEYCSYPEWPLLLQLGIKLQWGPWLHAVLCVGSFVWASAVLLLPLSRKSSRLHETRTT